MGGLVLKPGRLFFWLLRLLLAFLWLFVGFVVVRRLLFLFFLLLFFLPLILLFSLLPLLLLNFLVAVNFTLLSAALFSFNVLFQLFV